MQQNTTWKDDLTEYFPRNIARLLDPIDASMQVEEIRLRVGQPIELVCGEQSRLIAGLCGNFTLTGEVLDSMIGRITKHSLYAYEEEIEQGFISMARGYRLGIGGRAVVEDGKVKRITDVTSLNIRISRACIGIADAIMPKIVEGDGEIASTLVFSPPGAGKTTMLRDIVRQVSYGMGGIKPMRVAVIDERAELSGGMKDGPFHDLGPRTDVLLTCPKKEAFSLALRTLAPHVIVTDEIGNIDDAIAIEDASRCGVKVVASAHASSIEELKQRDVTARLIRNGALKKIVALGRSRGVGSIEGVYDIGNECINKGVRICCVS